MVTVEEYLNKTAKSIKLPSGFTFKIRTLSSFDIIGELGDVPFDATLLNQEPSSDGNNKTDGNNKIDNEQAKKLLKILPKLVEKAIIEPQGMKWEYLDGADKDVLVNEILKSLNVNENVASFREEK